MAKSTRTTSESIVREIKRNTRRHFSSEDKIRIVLEGLRGEYSIAEVCRREGRSTPANITSGAKILWKLEKSD